MKRDELRWSGIAILAGAAGIALNLIPIAALARLWPGRIATLPIAILYGPWYGALAALVCVAPLVRVTPILPVLFVVEALMVGAFARRGKPTLAAGAVFWTVTAVTFGLAPELFALGYLRPSVWPIALQQLLNGMIAVVIADLVAIGASVGRIVAIAGPPRRRRLRAYAFQAFVLVAVLPVLLLSAVNGHLFATRQENDGGARLHEAVAALRNHIDEYLTTHTRAVQALATAASYVADNHTQRERLLQEYHAIYEGFITLFLADPDGHVPELIPPQASGSEARQIGDREYFVDAVRNRRLTAPPLHPDAINADDRTRPVAVDVAVDIHR